MEPLLGRSSHLPATAGPNTGQRFLKLGFDFAEGRAGSGLAGHLIEVLLQPFGSPAMLSLRRLFDNSGKVSGSRLRLRGSGAPTV